MSLVALLLLAACNTDTATLDGKVVDIWGNPIEGATVMMEGTGERPMTDNEGRYSVNLVPGEHVMKAGREGYIQEHQTVTITKGETPDGPIFKLYPKPESKGYYVIATNKYEMLTPQTVKSVGNELRSHRGIKSVGEAHADSESLQILFHTDLKLDEINRLGLELHKLKYVKSDTLPGVDQKETEVTVNLYTSDAQVPIDITPMRSREDYLITPKSPIEPGYYAFETQDLLDSDDAEAFAQLPEELRKVFSFEYR